MTASTTSTVDAARRSGTGRGVETEARGTAASRPMERRSRPPVERCRPTVAALGRGALTTRRDGRVVGARDSAASSAAMKPVSTSPATKRGCSRQRTRKPALVFTGQTSTSAQASARPVGGRLAGVGVDDQLGDHRVVELADLAALLDAGVDADVVGQDGNAPAARCAAGSRWPGPRRRGGPPWPSRSWGCRPGSAAAGSPAATRNCHSTRSTPVMALGDRVFDLQPGVHLHEPDAVGLQARRRRRR